MPVDASEARALTGAAQTLSIMALDTPIGLIALHWRGARRTGALERVVLAAGGLDAPPAPKWLSATFSAYFQDPSQAIGLPARLIGTAFQQRVWRAIAAIPAGSTRTYGALAAALGSSPRAVGGACRANPCPLVVPCHRVVARQGLGGFAGDRGGRLLAIKRHLLAHEGSVLHSGS
jgi:methylated-DNA-[protein]-cysteine S-methyltransferase